MCPKLEDGECPSPGLPSPPTYHDNLCCKPGLTLLASRFDSQSEGAVCNLGGMIPARGVDLWLSDFSADPYEFAVTLPITPVLIARKGDPTGKRHLPARRNLVIVRHDFSIECTWDHAIEELVQRLGGWQAVEHVTTELAPCEAMIQFTLPIYGSPHQENNFVTPSLLGQLSRLRLGLGFEFGNHNPEGVDVPSIEE